jgi:hypothetical protein
MAASYPGVVKTYTDKVNGVDYVNAADVNSLQQEVQAVETALGANVATSSLPSAGSYNANGVSTSLTARLTNVEAGLTAGATDGTRVGYTLLYSGNFTSAPGALSVTGSSYQKFVVVISIFTAAAATPGVVSLTINGAASQRSSYVAWTSTGTITASSAGTTAFIGNGTAHVVNETITAEISNVSGTTFKPLTWTNNNGYGQGTITNSAAVTSITIAASLSYPISATYTIYGVK